MHQRCWVGYTLLLTLALFSSGLASAAKVTKVNKKKKIVVIDEGSEAGFSKGAKVCVFKKDKKVACGVVKKAKKKSAILGIKKINKVKKGYVAELKDAGSSGRGKGKAKKEKGDGGSKDGGAADYGFGITAYWPAYFLPSTVANFNKLSYNGLRADESTPPSLWKSEGTYTSSKASLSPLDMMITVGGELEFKSASLRLGFHYKQYRPFAAIADYEEANNNPYTQSDLSGSAIGGYLDYILLDLGSFSIGTGLDFDMSSLTMEVITKDDSGEQPEASLFSGTSSVSVVSLHFPMRYQIFFPSLHGGLFFGLNLMVPLAAMGGSTSLVSALEEADDNMKKVSETGDAAELSKDFETALGHGKSSYGLEIPIGIVIGF